MEKLLPYLDVKTQSAQNAKRDHPNVEEEMLFNIIENGEEMRRLGWGNDEVMQSYPARALDRKLQVDWARAAEEGPRVLMNPKVEF